jgi:Kef-type K+ transport system membrane component KefB/nucleotide-binding universal stress UspA family protein
MRLPKSRGGAVLAAGVGLFLSTCALGAEGPSAAPSEDITFLGEIVILIFVGQFLGEALRRIGQPAVMGPLLAGLLLGPSVLGAIWPTAQHAIFPASQQLKSMLAAVSQLGVLMLLLLTGMETDRKLVRKVGRAAVSVSIAGIGLPFACGVGLGEVLPESMLPNPGQRLISALFLGTALSISSVKIVAMVVREMNFMRRNLGQVIVAAAVIEDTIGWVMIAIIFSLASHGSLDLQSLAQSVAGTALFLAVSLTLGRRFVFALIRWANDHLMSDVPVITVILLLMGAMALITHLIGVQTVLGAFVAGILVGESPILTRHIDQQLRGLIMGLFMPVFFGVAGLSADLTILKDGTFLASTGGLIVVATVGKFAGAFLGGRLGGLTPPESLAIACGMNARGSTEVIVATIGLSMGVLSQNLFTMIVAMAIISTMMMPPMLRWALARLPLRKEEKARLELEEFEAKGFVPNLERLLLAVDDSANGKFASRLAGLIAGARGIPTTVLQMGPSARGQEANQATNDGAESAVKAGAQTMADVEEKATRTKPAKVDVTTRVAASGTKDAVASEARKGYDLLLIGVEKTTAADGGFHREVARIASGFEGPLAVVVARGDHLVRPMEAGFKILVAATGTEMSRRAAEVAVALARSGDVPITALYVSDTARGGIRKGRGQAATATRRHEEAILKDVVALADRYDTGVRTTMRVDVAPEEAILSEAARGGCTLIVMGVNRRPGDALFFGNIAAAVLERAEASILFVSG